MFSINGEEWDILAVSANHPKLMRSDGSRSVASCDDDTKIIYVDRTLQGAFLKKVLCINLVNLPAPNISKIKNTRSPKPLNFRVFLVWFIINFSYFNNALSLSSFMI